MARTTLFTSATPTPNRVIPVSTLRCTRTTRRRVPLRTAALIRELNPGVRGWGEYYKRAHVRRLFNQLDRWIVRRLWSHAHKRWRCAGWKTLPTRRLRGELGLVSLVALIPSLTPRPVAASS